MEESMSAGTHYFQTSTHEQVVSGHSGLSGNTSGDDNDFSTLEGGGDAEMQIGEVSTRKKTENFDSQTHSACS